jgi:hypothetical protein
MAKVGRPKNPPKIKELLTQILPAKELFSEEEVVIYKQLIEIYMGDFDKDDLSANDLDDIIDLSKSRILEFRLLKIAKEKPEAVLDISAALEKLRKENQKIKESLSSRRKDRYNPNEYKGFSIVDLAVAFDLSKKEKFADKISLLKQEEKEAISKRENYVGNRYDIDTNQKESEE